ncbi:phosphoenolpyruvate carboxylase kinase 1-like isoform X1 [Macadamia integrifolia]|uniref:phosphoenolpyruvate carboxylase kinase 1-like isoform X1 n=1 Tax=Macadamia integrifolia TaxID=60698 RepID=UPI001C4F6767|nr:phosphoenolpyruvate carboxylase kinase 1-like isoform X1 [Macadamia integrifolia]
MSDGSKKVYQVCEEIGRGRFGTVFRCFFPDSGDFFALKSIDKRLLSDSVDRECIDKEAKIMQLLSGNPNVVQIADVYEDDAYLDIVMELCDSSDLFDRVSKRIFSDVEAAAIMLPLMEGIAHCHRKGVAHRDIKPGNILFDSRNRLKLADFGSAEIFHDGESMKGIVGTPYYVAPEVLSGRDYSEKVDVWSAGVILYIMLSGIPPFYGDSVADVFEAVLRANLRFPARNFYSVSSAAKDLMRKMISKDVSKRFSAEQVLGHPWITSGGRS